MSPVMTQPIVGVMLYRWVMVSASRSLSYTTHDPHTIVNELVYEDGAQCEVRTGTFFCVMTTAVSFPRTAMEVCPEPVIALNAYSTSHKFRVSELRLGHGEGGSTHRLGTNDPRGRRR